MTVNIHWKARNREYTLPYGRCISGCRPTNKPTGWWPLGGGDYLPYTVLPGIMVTKLALSAAMTVVFRNGLLSLPVFLYFFPLFSPLHPLPSLTAFAYCQKVYTVGTPFDFFACVCLYCGFSDTPISPISFPQFPFHYFALWPRTHFPLLPGKPTDSTTPSPHLSIVSDDWTIIIVASGKAQQAVPARRFNPPA